MIDASSDADSSTDSYSDTVSEDDAKFSEHTSISKISDPNISDLYESAKERYQYKKYDEALRSFALV